MTCPPAISLLSVVEAQCDREENLLIAAKAMLATEALDRCEGNVTRAAHLLRCDVAALAQYVHRLRKKGAAA